jgi:septum formation protein
VDTIGVIKGKILGKPRDQKHALELLKTLSGTKHKVISGICVIDTAKNIMITDYEETTVEIDKLTPAQIKSYLALGEGRDKAAGYAIQGRGAIYIKGIQGDYFNVVGLPIYKLAKILAKLGVKW